MLQNDQVRYLLETELSIGGNASAAWESIKPFFEEKKEQLYEAFLAGSVADADSLVKIKMQMNVLVGMENYFQEKITTAKLATIALRSEEHGK